MKAYYSNKNTGTFNVGQLMCKLLVCSMVTMVVLFVSCDKDDSSYINFTNSPKSQSIPYFLDRDAVWTAITTAMSFDSVSQLLEYEQISDRQSIGALSDAFYEKINIGEFENQEDVIAYYNANTDFLDTIVEFGEVLISPKWFDSPYRFVANIDGLFIVGNQVYRLFNRCMVSTNISNLNLLTSLNESDVNGLDASTFNVSYKNTNTGTLPHEGCVNGWYYKDKLQDDNDYVAISIETQNVYYPYIGYNLETLIHVYSRHKFLGIWWLEKHTLTCKGSVSWHSRRINENNMNTWISGSREIDTARNCFNLWIGVHSEPTIFPVDVLDYHYQSLAIRARTPDLAYAEVYQN